MTEMSGGGRKSSVERRRRREEDRQAEREAKESIPLLAV